MLRCSFWQSIWSTIQMVYKIFYIHCLEILKSPNPTRRQALSPPTVYVRYHTASTVMQVMEVIGRSSERKDPGLSVYQTRFSFPRWPSLASWLAQITNFGQTHTLKINKSKFIIIIHIFHVNYGRTSESTRGNIWECISSYM